MQHRSCSINRLRTALAVSVAAAFVSTSVLTAAAQQGTQVPDSRDSQGNRGDQRGSRPPRDGDKSGPGTRDSTLDKDAQKDANKGATKDKDGRPGSKSAEADKQPKPIPRYLRRPGSPAIPEGGAQRAKLLAELYAWLATATDEQVANRTANAIEHVWQSTTGDTVNILLERGAKAANEKKFAVAEKLMERAVQLAPDNPQVFYRRAMVYYEQTDMERAMGDLRRALALEPNHFKSLEAMGQILKELERKKAALQVYRRLYEIHPYYSGVKSNIDELQREVEGQAS